MAPTAAACVLAPPPSQVQILTGQLQNQLASKVQVCCRISGVLLHCLLYSPTENRRQVQAMGLRTGAFSVCVV